MPLNSLLELYAAPWVSSNKGSGMFSAMINWEISILVAIVVASDRLRRIVFMVWLIKSSEGPISGGQNLAVTSLFLSLQYHLRIGVLTILQWE
jgi:hypothetical protein